MDFSTITSPADLVKANEANPFDVLIDQLDKLSPEAALSVAQLLTSKLYELHVRMAHRNDVTNPIAWARDAGRLEIALSILDDINF